MGRILLLVLLLPFAAAQRGTAPNNYYPSSYNGSIFTGTVVRTTADTISLEYGHRGKIESFEARALAACDLPVTKDTQSPGTLAQVPLGWVVTAYYEPLVTKTGGKKEKYKPHFAGSKRTACERI